MIQIFDEKQFYEAKKALDEQTKFGLFGTDYVVTSVEYDFQRGEGHFAIMPLVPIAVPEERRKPYYDTY